MITQDKRMGLFRAVFRVQPTPDHLEWQRWNYGWLSIWLLDDLGQMAALRAAAILEQLPYANMGLVRVSVDTRQQKPAEVEQGEEWARIQGVSFLLVTGPDDLVVEKFLRMDCPESGQEGIRPLYRYPA